jgi:hypothetical protein
VGTDDYTLIVGHSGVGKTAISLNLVRTRGKKLFSGNKTLVAVAADGSLQALAGTPTMTARTKDTARHSADAATSGYQDRSAFLLEEGMYAASGPVPLRAIVLARLNDGAADFFQLSPTSALHKLFPFFMDAVNADTVLCGGKEVFGGDPSSDTRARLSATLADVLTTIPVYSVAGSMPFVTEHLAAL